MVGRAAPASGGARPVVALAPGTGTLRPLPALAARLASGFWFERTAVNAARSLAAGLAQLEATGTLENLRLAAGTAQGDYRGTLPFLDTDVFKWLEAVSWQLQQGESGGWSPADAKAWSVAADEVIELVAAAQAPDGYLDSYVDVVLGGERWGDLHSGHELYCAGHLIQAGVAHRRATGRENLYTVAVRFADLIVEEFGEGGRRVGYCGHPQVETALVELYRESGARKYLDLAGRFVDLRGSGLLGEHPFGRRYFQDVTPVRETHAVHGHAVRALYLAAGVADVYLETREPELLAALESQWDDMVRGKTYITGGTGSRHRDEAFGDAFELPPDLAYTETCAAIALMQWAWRMLLATGHVRYADMFERVLYNGFLAGVSLAGDHFFYVNPLQVRPHSTLGPEGRQEWFHCACCPPNVMRTLASLRHYLATGDADGIQIHQYLDGSIRAGAAGVDISTGYPFDGGVRLSVPAQCAGEWTLSLRIPPWARGAAGLELDGAALAADETEGYLRVRRSWRGGERVELTLPIRPELTAADPRVDAVRGCAAVERGPLVYCLEQRDQEASIDEVRLLGPARDVGPIQVADVAVPGIELDAEVFVTREPVPEQRASAAPLRAYEAAWGYRPVGSGTRHSDVAAHPHVTLTAIPYFAWANRDFGAMRVWTPLA
ncbi:glycoside hydrolase family 127 protein [Actinospica durhamensis]|uniref:Glycoside hydrolase family 127 protein n=1 Tax=Actinospica durhamensis TaxID=1508375 RepID=A0A941IVH9_9ACTN|nr:beta-L-arabinofuranosidase domain-containing protein [Actinospica durhamensis]MBR7839398.1 glycoside hydrolase family 127 protein [Actinospica durhamensis]